MATATAPSSLATSPPPTLTFHVRMRAAACFTAGPEAQAREEGHAESTAALAASAAASREEASPLASSPLMPCVNRGVSGCTLLLIAAGHGHKQLLEVMLKCGAKLDAQNSVGLTALMAAAVKGHVQVIETLLRHGPQ